MQFQQTVPRQLVHRASVSEVFLTDVGPANDNSCQVAAQWPRAHGFFTPRGGAVDPMLFVETVRQATLAIGHSVLAIPADAKFIWHETSYQISEHGLQIGDRPVDVVLSATVHDPKRGEVGLSGFRLEFDCHRDGRWIGSSSVRVSCLTPATYTFMRGQHGVVMHLSTRRGTAVEPELVGRTQVSDVVLAEAVSPDTSPDGSPHRWPLLLDRSHPVMFEHPMDHVPGMVIMEAARQAALLTLGKPGALAFGSSFSFSDYIELNEPCEVIVDDVMHASSTATAQVRFEQGGRTAAQGELDLLLKRGSGGAGLVRQATKSWPTQPEAVPPTVSA